MIRKRNKLLGDAYKLTGVAALGCTVGELQVVLQDLDNLTEDDYRD